MKKLALNQMEVIEGGDNLDILACTLTTVAWALGTLTAVTGFGLFLWGIGAVTSVYCNSRTAGLI